MYQMTQTEEKFADFVWEHEPVGSGELVKLCGDAFGWKKSTTYTFIKKLCGQGILKNEKAVVTSLITREEYLQGQGEAFVIPKGQMFVRVKAADHRGNREGSRSYRIVDAAAEDKPGSGAYSRRRLLCRGMLDGAEDVEDGSFVTRQILAQMMMPMADPTRENHEGEETCSGAMRIAVGNALLALKDKKRFCQEDHVSRQEMATVAMQACGVNYRNASSTMPVCADGDQVSNNYGTNVARALYFGFMELDEKGCFDPDRLVTMGEAVDILNKVADFAGI